MFVAHVGPQIPGHLATLRSAVIRVGSRHDIWLCLRFVSFLQDDPSRRRLPPTAAAVAASMGTVTDVVAVISMRMTIPVTGARTVAAAWVRFAGSHAGNVIARSPDRAVTA